MKQTHFLSALLLVCALSSGVRAAVTLPPVIGNNMVVQSGEPLNFWGWADKGEKVTIKVGGVVVVSTVGEGNARTSKPWRMQLPAQKAGQLPDIEVVASNSITITNVLAGDVWLCSGQSNMVKPLSRKVGYGGVLNEEQELAAADDNQIRVFQGAAWEVCTPESAAHFSAVGFFFAQRLRSGLKGPVGLLVLAAGGTAVERFIPARMIEGDAGLRALKAKAQTVHNELGPKGDAYGKAYKEMKLLAAEAKKKGEKGPPPPTNQLTAEESKRYEESSDMMNFGAIYDRIIRPVIPYNIKGCVWYQGEANGKRGDQYAPLLTKLIQSWREDWGKPLPFVIVALAGWGKPEAWTPGAQGSFPLVREAGMKVAETLPNVGVISALDVGESREIHPLNKRPVGERAALWALDHVYGQKVVSAGPSFGKVTFSDGKATVAFTRDAEGLALRGPGGFELAGEDRKFFPGKAGLNGTAIEVTAAEVSKPVALRYAFQNFPECTVYNATGLPALPFRTDDWPVRTAEPIK